MGAAGCVITNPPLCSTSAPGLLLQPSNLPVDTSTQPSHRSQSNLSPWYRGALIAVLQNSEPQHTTHTHTPHHLAAPMRHYPNTGAFGVLLGTLPGSVWNASVLFGTQPFLSFFFLVLTGRLVRVQSSTSQYDRTDSIKDLSGSSMLRLTAAMALAAVPVASGHIGEEMETQLFSPSLTPLTYTLHRMAFPSLQRQ